MAQQLTSYGGSHQRWSQLPARPRRNRLPINHFGRIIGALFSPQATFQDIVRRPSWVAPIVLFSLLGLGFSWVMNQRVDWESFIRQQAEKNSRFAQLSEEQKQRALAPHTKYAPMFAYVIGLLGAPLLVLILASVYLGAFNLFAGQVCDSVSRLGSPPMRYCLR